MKSQSKIFRFYSLVACALMLLSGVGSNQAQARATFVTTTLPNATVGQAYSFKIQATGDFPPVTFEKWYFTYPGAEMVLASDGTLSGTPQTPGSFELGVRAVDGALGVYQKFAFVVQSAGNPTTVGVLALSNDPTLPNGSIPAGAVNYTFAAFKLQAGNSPVTVNSLQIVSDSASSGEFRDIVLYKDASQFVGGTAASLSGTGQPKAATFTFNPSLSIAAGSTMLLEVRASITAQASGQVRLGIGSFSFVGTAPSITPALPFYGPSTQVSGDGSPPPAQATFTVTPSTANCTATTGTVVISVQGISGTTYTIKKNSTDLATISGSGTYTDTISVGVATAYSLFAAGTQVGQTATVTVQRQAGCGTSGTVSVTISRTEAVPATQNVTAGQKNVALFEAKIMATGGDAFVHALYMGGSAVNDLDKLENERAQEGTTITNGVGGGEVAGGNSVVATYQFTSPIQVPKDGSKTVKFLADIVATASGTSQPRITGYLVKDSVGNQISSVSLTGVVGTTLNISSSNNTNLSITSPERLPDGTAGSAYRTTLSATGGSGTYTWSELTGVSSTYPCCHLRLTAAGVVESTGQDGKHLPYSGAFQIGAKVTDSAGSAAQKTFQLTVKPAGSAGTVVISEGYLDALSKNSFSGWVYSSKAVSESRLPNVSIIFENVNDTSKTYTLTLQPTATRSDVIRYLENKYNTSLPGQTLVGLSGNPSSVISADGVYRIKSATYDGINIVLSDAAKRSFTIGTTPTLASEFNRYVKVDGDKTIYWIVFYPAKMPILSQEVFNSYGSKFEDVKIISQEALDDYDDVEYIKLSGNARVYKIHDGLKQYLTPAAATRLSVDPAKVVPVNRTEFLSYRTGSTIR